MSGLLVTGTDTGVGKTVVACALAADLVRRGLNIAVWKPAETGWNPSAEETSDAARLQRAAGSTEPLEVICPYRLREALAPAVAARVEGVFIDLGHLARLYHERRVSSDVLIVEGAGGLLVPLVDRTTYADLARDLDLSLLIVAPNRLGVINHTALTARVAAAEGLRVIGFVLNNGQSHTRSQPSSSAMSPADTECGPKPHSQNRAGAGLRGPGIHPEFLVDPSTTTNRSAIMDLTGLPCLGEIPYEPRAADEPERVSAYLDVSGILTAVARTGRD
jgi:dethiobiotin synthetase